MFWGSRWSSSGTPSTCNAHSTHSYASQSLPVHSLPLPWLSWCPASGVVPSVKASLQRRIAAWFGHKRAAASRALQLQDSPSGGGWNDKHGRQTLQTDPNNMIEDTQFITRLSAHVCSQNNTSLSVVSGVVMSTAGACPGTMTWCNVHTPCVMSDHLRHRWQKPYMRTL